MRKTGLAVMAVLAFGTGGCANYGAGEEGVMDEPAREGPDATVIEPERPAADDQGLL